MLQRMLVIERDQRIILDDQQPLDARRARRNEHRNSVPPRHDALPPVVQYRFDLPSTKRCFYGYERDLSATPSSRKTTQKAYPFRGRHDALPGPRPTAPPRPSTADGRVGH